ncbi:hypothetical protein ABVT39_008379 [Epinephelus coioides]
METSDLLSVRSSRLCPDVAEPDRRSALEVLISTASVGGSVNTGIKLSLPTCLQSPHRLAVKHIHIVRINSIDTHTLSWTVTHTRYRDREHAVTIVTAVSLGAPRSKRISITANYLHPFTLKDSADCRDNTVFFSAK